MQESTCETKLGLYLAQVHEAALSQRKDVNLPSLDDVCNAYIQQVLEVSAGNHTQAAQILGIGRTSLYRHLKRRKTADAKTRLRIALHEICP